MGNIIQLKQSDETKAYPKTVAEAVYMADGTSVEEEIENLKDSAYVTGTASGDIAVFSDGAAVDAKSVVINIEPIQSGSGDPSPDNVRAISGRTGATVTRTGKNLFFANCKQGTRSGLTFTPINNGSSFIVNGTAEGNVAITLNTGATAPEKIFKGQTYTLSGGHWPNTGVAYIQLVYKGDETGNTISIVSAGDGGVNTISVNENATLSGIYINFVNGNTFTNDLVQPQFEIGSSATPFVPYTGTTIPISWETEAGTVYGGTLDVVSGVLTVTHKMVDGGSLNWAYWTNDSFYVTANDKYSRAVKDVICSCYPSIVGNVSATFGIYVSLSSYNTRNNIYLADTQYSHDAAGAAQLKADMTGQQIVYPLATSQTYQLTPHQIHTLLGENVIYSDAGSVDVDYRADTKKYVESKIAAQKNIIAGVEASYTATKNYSVGELLIVGETLYKVISNIASGATITPGTNVTATTVAEQLLLLASA